MKRRFHRADAVVLALTAMVAALCLVWLFSPRSSGTQVAVTSPAGEALYSLSIPAQFVVEGANGHTVTVKIERGRVRVAQSDCPDKVCVSSSWLSHSGQAAVCVPAAVSVRVVGGTADIDGVTA